MRVMMMIKGDPEPGAVPGEELLAAMSSYNDELKQAGVLLDLAGLLPSVAGRRVRFSGGDRAVVDGPFPESKQLIAGYWILQKLLTAMIRVGVLRGWSDSTSHRPGALKLICRPAAGGHEKAPTGRAE